MLLIYARTQDLKREFVTELIYPAVQANCIYEVHASSNLNYRWDAECLHRMSTCWAHHWHDQSLLAE